MEQIGASEPHPHDQSPQSLSPQRATAGHLWLEVSLAKLRPDICPHSRLQIVSTDTIARAGGHTHTHTHTSEAKGMKA
jgi:hypothetical protein